MYVIADINGKQYKLEEGRYLHVDRLSQAEDEVVEIGNVLMVVDGDQTMVGAPFVEGAKIKAKVLSHGRDKKVIVYKMRPKKGYRRKNGHRQQFTRLQVEVIEFPGKKASAKPAKAAEPKKESKAKAKPEAKEEEKKAEKAPKKEAAKKPAAKKETAKKPAKKTETKATAKADDAKADKPKKAAAKKTETKKPAAKKTKKDDA